MEKSGNDELGELLSAYLDGELSEQETAFVEGTVLQDEPARALLDDLRRNAELVGSLPHHQAPASICEDLKSHLERQELLGNDDLPLEVVDHERRSWFEWVSMAAMVALVAVSGFWMLSTVSTKNRGEQDRVALLGPNESAGVEKKGGDAKPPQVFGTKKSETRMRSRRTAKQPSGMVEKASGPTVEQKLAMGESIESLRLHSFDAEPVRIRMVIPASDRRDAVAEKLAASFSKSRAVNLQKSFKGKRRDRERAKSKGFFYEGSSGKNFAGTNSRQILVRVPVSVLDTLLRDLGRGNQGIESIELSAGQLVYRGVSNIRSTLSLLDGQAKAQDSVAADSEPASSRNKRKHVAARSMATQALPSKDFSFLRELSMALADHKKPVGGESTTAETEGIVGPPAPPEAPVAASTRPAGETAAGSTDVQFVTLVVQLDSGEPAALPKTTSSKGPSAPKAKPKIDRARKNGGDKPIQ